MCYTFTHKKGFGSGTSGWEGAQYPNRAHFEENMRLEHGNESTTITNILEVSKKDYDSFFAEDAQ